MVEKGRGGGERRDDLEAIGDGVRSTDGWMVVGWLSAGSKGGARSSFRGTVALGNRGWCGRRGRRRQREGREKEKESGSTRAERPRGRADTALGVLRMEPTGRRVEVGGDAMWVEATTSKSDFRSTCFASASSTLYPLPSRPPFRRITHPLPLPAPIVRVSLTHNSRALYPTASSRSPVIFDRRRPRTMSSTLAYFAHTRYTLLRDVCSLVADPLLLIASTDSTHKICCKLSRYLLFNRFECLFAII